MKDIDKLKNYRLKYKRYYNIDFDNTYDIHHMDFNHNNNDIDNLLLLPKKLHAKYHLCLEILGCPTGKLEFNAKINANFEGGQYIYLKMLGEALEEISKWKYYKMQLEFSRNSQNGNRGGK